MSSAAVVTSCDLEHLMVVWHHVTDEHRHAAAVGDLRQVLGDQRPESAS
jgi:hypothetical protein